MLTWFCRLRFRSSLSYVYCKVLTVKNDTYNWGNSTVLWHLHTDMIKIRTIMATTTTVMMISQKLLSSWSTNKNGLLIKTQNIIFFKFPIGYVWKYIIANKIGYQNNTCDIIFNNKITIDTYPKSNKTLQS